MAKLDERRLQEIFIAKGAERVTVEPCEAHPGYSRVTISVGDWSKSDSVLNDRLQEPHLVSRLTEMLAKHLAR